MFKNNTNDFKIITGPEQKIWNTINLKNEMYCVDYIPHIEQLYRDLENEEFGEKCGFGEHNFFSYKKCDFNEFGEKKMKNMCIKVFREWRQKDVTLKMRLFLLDWLVNVHRKFKLVSQSLYLAICLLDRFLSIAQISPSQLQLVGCSCLWIASKYHDIIPPAMSDFIYISDNAFTTDELKECEGIILKKLEYNITLNTCLSFIELYIPMIVYPLKLALNKESNVKEIDKIEKKIKLLKSIVMFMSEHSLLDYDLANNYRPSIIAAAVIAYTLLGLKIEFHNYPCDKEKLKNISAQKLKDCIWTQEYINNTGYSLQQLKHIIIKLDLLRKQPNFTAIANKYAIDFRQMEVVQTFFAN